MQRNLMYYEHVRDPRRKPHVMKTAKQNRKQNETLKLTLT